MERAVIRLALHQPLVEQLVPHVQAAAPNEEGAFCLLRSGQGIEDLRLLATDALLPGPTDWELQHPDQLRPSAVYCSRAISHAINHNAGLLFVHSHPDPRFPVGLSPTDVNAIHALGEEFARLIDGPFGAIVISPNGWAGVLWTPAGLVHIDRIWSVGRNLQLLSPPQPGKDSPLDARQRDALGIIHDRVRILRVGVVGAGGLGSPMAEQVVRMGAREALLVDPDRLDTPSNVRRVLGSTVRDMERHPPPFKVDIVGDHLESLGFDVVVRRIPADVRTERAYRALLDMDVVLNGTDTHGSRAMVNELASTYLLPVIDVGVRVSARGDARLAGLVAEVRVLTPTTPCLWCRGTINADMIRIENLPAAEREQLRREGYAPDTMGAPVPSVMALTMLGSSMATCALLTLLSEDGAVVPPGYIMDGFHGDAFFLPPHDPADGCRCQRRLGLGDTSPPGFLVDQATEPVMSQREGR
jgi:molybdopterin/thiamine biosynthesis adenylyltransferase